MYMLSSFLPAPAQTDSPLTETVNHKESLQKREKRERDRVSETSEESEETT